MKKPLVNKVAEKAIITIDPAKLIPDGIKGLDIAPFLDRGLILREKDFRSEIKAFDWSKYKGAHVFVFCSTDAILPMWSYMLIAAQLKEVASDVCFKSSEKDATEHFVLEAIEKIELHAYEDQRVIIKGCSNKLIGPAVYIKLTDKLTNFAKAISFGEACSMVPVHKTLRK